MLNVNKSFESLKNRKTSIVSNESQSSMKTVDITPEPPQYINNTNNINTTKFESDPYAFLDVKHIENATPIKLHEHSPIVGPRQNSHKFKYKSVIYRERLTVQWAL